jgi:hypothetical protein
MNPTNWVAPPGAARRVEEHLIGTVRGGFLALLRSEPGRSARRTAWLRHRPGGRPGGCRDQHAPQLQLVPCANCDRPALPDRDERGNARCEVLVGTARVQRAGPAGHEQQVVVGPGPPDAPTFRLRTAAPEGASPRHSADRRSARTSRRCPPLRVRVWRRRAVGRLRQPWVTFLRGRRSPTALVTTVRGAYRHEDHPTLGSRLGTAVSPRAPVPCGWGATGGRCRSR